VSEAARRERQRPGPLTYLITFTCYGTHLHGEEGTVDRDHNVPGTPTLRRDSGLLKLSATMLKEPPYELDHARREHVLRGIRWACERRGWTLIAAHVRTNHVHAIVSSDKPPEDVLIALKAYTSRALNEAGLDGKDRRRWARHGSTRYLRSREVVARAMDYVLEKQGEPMEVFCADW
jgi:REP element-mobilizing transposase RayT